MLRIKILPFLSLLMLVFVACQKDDDENIPVVTRTVFMYLVGDNDISSDIYPNIASVEQGLSKATSPGTFVIYWDGGSHYTKEFPTPTLFKYDVDGKGNVSKRTVIRTYNEQNSVSSNVMLTVFADMQRLCPAESYGLIFGSHATGWLPAELAKNRSFGDDGGNKINVPELAQVLEESSIHFDFILFDACLMSQVEVAYELRNVADYLILSPAEVLSLGFPYSKIAKDMLSTDNLRQSVINVASGFIDYYRNESSYKWATIAVVKTSEMQALANITYSIMEQYSANLSDFNSSKLSSFQSRFGYGRGTLGYSSYDFKAFVRELAGGTVPLDFEEQLERTVIYKDYENSDVIVNIDSEIYSGIGCYIPYNGYNKWNTHFKNFQWYSAGGWAEAGW